ncbi:Ribosomal biogenesis protein LAS1L [Holothuria leucospilota]|uniref:Ribosomal biogenesis protein LAS1L n=1 Tax=Holothuria leucospilota TaxID=206669 RepID=A0A9Q1BJ43_HOLLE|nr:Ribosomal biogenesis protein LAS1L [Holothuria leucospilota]
MPCQRKGAPTVVPWISVREFYWVQSSLFSDDNESVREAYERVLVWQARLGTKTPIAIECTINLIEAKLADNGQLKENHLAKLFSLALVRSITLITHSMQSGGALTPMQVLARQSGIPEWIVQFRHDTSHSVGSPSFSLAKAGVYFMISWLKDNFWDVYVPQPVSAIDEPLDYSAEDDIRDLLLAFQQQQFQTFLSGQGPSKKLKKTLKKLTDRLKSEDSRSVLFCQMKLCT